VGEHLRQWSLIAAIRSANRKRIKKAHATAQRGVFRRVLGMLVEHACQQQYARRADAMEERVREQQQRKNRNLCASITRAWRAWVQQQEDSRRIEAERSRRREQMLVVLEAASRRALEQNAHHDQRNAHEASGDGDVSPATRAIYAAHARRGGEEYTDQHWHTLLSTTHGSCGSYAHQSAHQSGDKLHAFEDHHRSDLERAAQPGSGEHSADLLSEENPETGGRVPGGRGGRCQGSSEQNIAFHTSVKAMAERQVSGLLLVSLCLSVSQLLLSSRCP
jgi:hypothetical protein